MDASFCLWALAILAKGLPRPVFGDWLEYLDRSTNPRETEPQLATTPIRDLGASLLGSPTFRSLQLRHTDSSEAITDIRPIVGTAER